MQEEIDLRVNLAGIELANPVVIASGVFGFGEEFEQVEGFDADAPGAVVLKSVTLEPRQGNRPPRIAETPSGMLNSIGLQNPGVKVFTEEILPSLSGYVPKLIANIAGHSEDDYARVAEAIAAASSAELLSALEANISCPNVKQGGIAFGTKPETAARVIAGIKTVTDLPVIAKLTPAANDIVAVAQACIEAGADVLSLINTLPAMVIDTQKRRPLLGNRVGGLSGPAIRPVAVLLVHRVYEVAGRTETPIVGIGGITNADDAMQFILAGATATGVGCSLFWNYSVCTDLIDGLRTRLKRDGVGSIAELVGALE